MLVRGLQKYGSKEEEAAEKELIQVHKMDALRPIDTNSLSDDEKKKAIASLILLLRNKMAPLRLGNVLIAKHREIISTRRRQHHQH